MLMFSHLFISGFFLGVFECLPDFRINYLWSMGVSFESWGIAREARIGSLTLLSIVLEVAELFDDVA